MKVKQVSNAALMVEVRELLSAGKKVVLRAKGNSMLPFIHGGKDSIRIVKAEHVRVGDILLCEITAGRYVIHRLVRKEQDRLWLMGDGNVEGREICRPNNVVGKVVTIIRRDRATDCNSRSFRRKVRWWIRLLPVRRYLLAVYKRIHHIED